MSVVYNTLNHKMIIASTMIAVIVCDPVINKETSDGFTHTKPVSCVLYNHLYKVVHIICYKLYVITYNTHTYYIVKYLIKSFLIPGSFYWNGFLYNSMGSMAWKSFVSSNPCA